MHAENRQRLRNGINGVPKKIRPRRKQVRKRRRALKVRSESKRSQSRKYALNNQTQLAPGQVLNHHNNPHNLEEKKLTIAIQI